MTPATLDALRRYLAHGRHPDAPPGLYDACRAALEPAAFATPDGRAWPDEGRWHRNAIAREEAPRLAAPCDFPEF